MTRLDTSLTHLPRWVVALGIVMAMVAGSVVTPAPVASAAADDDWLGIINEYRAASGVAPVVADPNLQPGTDAHACWQSINQTIGHSEPVGSPGYSAAGSLAGSRSNVAGGPPDWLARDFIDGWMAAPFHTIGMLRPQLAASWFSRCNTGNSPMQGAVVDVISNLGPRTPRDAAIVFPGRNATTHLAAFTGESPDPTRMCHWADGEPRGLPILAMMPSGFSQASGTLIGPDGPIDSCVLHGEGSTMIADGQPARPTAGLELGRSILGDENAVVLIPDRPLTSGRWTVEVTTDTSSTSWEFGVNLSGEPGSVPVAPTHTPPVPTLATADPGRIVPVTPYRAVDTRAAHGGTRVSSGGTLVLDLTDNTDYTAVSANITAVGAAGSGFLTVYRCSDPRPTASTVNYTERAVANAAVVPVDDHGRICIYAKTETDVIVDVNGWASVTGDGDYLMPVTPVRVVDTRSGHGGRLADGETRRFDLDPGGLGAAVSAVQINLTAVGPGRQGHLRIWDCAAGLPDVSTVNFAGGETRANAAIARLSATGELCVYAMGDVDVLIDVFGYFTAQSVAKFTPLVPTRLVDTRSSSTLMRGDLQHVGTPLLPDQPVMIQVAGANGVPAGAKAATVNVTAVTPLAPGFLTVYPCGARPSVSNVNYGFDRNETATPNSVTVPLDAHGRVCVYSLAMSHVIVDITGVWVN